MEIVIQPAYRRFNYLYIPAKYTGQFLPGQAKSKKPVVVDTESGTTTAELQYNSIGRV